MRGLLTVSVLLLAVLLLYRFHRPILDALRRFDSRNTSRRMEEVRDRHDRLAHYKHTLRLAEEQVEEIGEIAAADERTGVRVVRFLFEGEVFGSRDQAEAARNEAVVAKAREFYVELPKALARHGDGKLRRD